MQLYVISFHPKLNAFPPKIDANWFWRKKNEYAFHP
jgi:hypothetical protein